MYTFLIMIEGLGLLIWHQTDATGPGWRDESVDQAALGYAINTIRERVGRNSIPSDMRNYVVKIYSWPPNGNLGPMKPIRQTALEEINNRNIVQGGIDSFQDLDAAP